MPLKGYNQDWVRPQGPETGSLHSDKNKKKSVKSDKNLIDYGVSSCWGIKYVFKDSHRCISHKKEDFKTLAVLIENTQRGTSVAVL